MYNTTLDLVFPAVGGKEVVSRNDGGDITFDERSLLVSLSDKKLGLTRAISRSSGGCEGGDNAEGARSEVCGDEP
jgi:hypothetical protein